MKPLILFLVFSFPTFIFADSSKDKLKNKEPQSNEKINFANHPIPLSSFDVIPLNSPVRESVAKFLLKTPNGFEIDEVRYKIRNANHLFDKDSPHQKISLVDGANGKELNISISKLPPGFYQLYVKIRDRKNKEHEYKTQYKNYAKFVIDNSLQVPMPNEKENNKTIAGIDSDGDGIRDDVQRWINEEFSTNSEIKSAIRQIAIGKQMDLLNSANREQSILISKKVLDSNHCLYSLTGLSKGAKIIRELNSKLLNTKERIYAEVKANSNFSGQAYDLPVTKEDELALCDFDIVTP